MTKKEKALLNAFGDRYTALEHNGGYLLYDKTRKAKRSNYQYLGKFYISTAKDKYVYNDDVYGDIDSLVEAMELYNQTLPFDAEIYNPIFRKNYMVECALHDYLISLGFKADYKHMDVLYVLNDAYGQNICALTYKVVEDTTEGVITRYIPSQDKWSDRWLENPFNDLDSAIGAVNSMIATYCTLINAQVIRTLNAMTNSRCSIMLNKGFDMRTMSVYIDDAKNQAIEYLENELKALKGE